MLRLTIHGDELFNEETSEFTHTETVVIELEHSLVSLAKWEQKYLKPFLGPEEKTREETLGYIEAMIVNPDYPSDFLERLTPDHLSEVNDYIDSPATATTFASLPSTPGSKKTQIITAELVYYWMLAATIPFECQYWHLNRLFALIRICDLKNSKPKKMSKSEIAARNRALNEERKAKLGTTG